MPKLRYKPVIPNEVATEDHPLFRAVLLELEENQVALLRNLLKSPAKLLSHLRQQAQLAMRAEVSQPAGLPPGAVREAALEVLTQSAPSETPQPELTTQEEEWLLQFRMNLHSARSTYPNLTIA